jgi:aspartyl-tRNA(Asn)/glutamyl-tRNA(Gln) amidotransferase subunit C
MISEDKVKHIAKLARLGLTEKEIEKFQKELSAILDYFEKLKEVDISGVEPTSHSVPRSPSATGMAAEGLAILVENVMREDKESPASAKAMAGKEKLLELTPETKDGYLKVKSILPYNT